MSWVLGKDAKLYYKTGGQSGGGSWTELTNARDVTLNLEAGEADLSIIRTTPALMALHPLVSRCMKGNENS